MSRDIALSLTFGSVITSFNPLLTFFCLPSLRAGFADAAIAPIDFPIAPTVAIPLALKNAGLSIEDISLFEINEAFSVVVRAAEKVLSLDPAKVNVSRSPALPCSELVSTCRS